MQIKSVFAGLAVAATVAAQNATANSTSANSICDKYTTALLMDNTAENQLMLLTLLVNTVVIGNYTNGSKVAVPGILAPGMVNDTKVNLLPYFDGGLASTSRGGKPTAMNFLDDGGAVPLMMNKPANGTNSNQYFLLTHLYQFFGTLLGCSKQGSDAYPSYQGVGSMGQVHQYMDLSLAENTYFINQVALAAQSFGVADDDIKTVGTALNSIFNVRCAPAPTTGPLKGLGTQSICQDSTCPLAQPNDCSQYIEAVTPGVANATLAQGEGNASNTAANLTGTTTGGTTGGTASASKAAAAHIAGSGVAAAGLGLLAFLL